jgi:hypothetical protein
MHTQSHSRISLRSSRCAALARSHSRSASLCLLLGASSLGCAREGVDLGGDTLARDIQRGTRCLESSVVDADVVVSQQDELDALAGCEEFRGNLIVRAFAGADLTPLGALRRVDGELALGAPQTWDAITGFLITDRLDPQRELIAAGWVQSLDGVQALEHAGALFLRGLPDADLTAFESLTSVGSAGSGLGVILQQNLHLRNLTGLERLSGLSGLVVTLSPELVSLNGLDATGLSSVSLYTSSALTDLSALAPVTTLDSLQLFEIGVRDLSAFAGLHSTEFLGLVNNAALVDASGLGALDSADSINVSGNPALEVLPSFVSFTLQPRTIAIRDNPALESVVLDFSNAPTRRYDIQGVPERDGDEYVGYELGIDVIDVRNNARLQSISVPAGLTKAHLMLASENPALESIDLGSLTELGQLSIDANASLSQVDIGALARVSLLQIIDNPLLSPAVFDDVQAFAREISGNAE